MWYNSNVRGSFPRFIKENTEFPLGRSMKKKFLSMGAIALGAMLLTSCVTTNNRVSFNENWHLDTTASSAANLEEVLKYEVAFEKGSNAENEYRAILYGTGEYVTTLKTEYSEEKEAFLYRYTTELKIPVTFECKTSEEMKTYQDVVTSNVLFMNAQSGLKPISSTKTYDMHSPTTMSDSPSKLTDCYTHYNYTVQTDYNDDLTGKSALIDHTKNDEKRETNFKSANDDYTTLDNEQLLLAVRGIETLGMQKFSVYTSSWKKSLLVGLSASTSTSDEFELKLGDSAPAKKTIAYTPVTMKFDVQDSGSEQTLWIANRTDVLNNTYRNVILYMQMPLYYSYGSLNYTLKEAKFM